LNCIFQSFYWLFFLSLQEELSLASKKSHAMTKALTLSPTTKKDDIDLRVKQTLSEYIKTHFNEFSRSQKDVAQYLVDHLEEVAFLTSEQLAKRASTSSSTVVRFAQALGFEGYPGMQQAAREEYRKLTQSGDSGFASPLFSVDQSDFESVVAADHSNIEDTASKLSRRAVDKAINDLVDAKWILIAGTDQMAFFASYLRHLLMLLDIRCDVVASPSQEALTKIDRIHSDSLVVALSAGRSHPLVLRALKMAEHCEASTVAITDSTISEVAKLADTNLYYSSSNPAYIRSHTALLSIIQALAFGVYSRDADRFDDRIKAFRLK